MRWIDAKPPDLSIAQGLHPLVGQILHRRGVDDPKAVKAFLDSDSYSPTPGTDIPGLVAAADRLEDAVKHEERICVWGDFDADGQTATTVLVQTLRALGADVNFHIPVRAFESHGVNLPNLKLEIDLGAQLILTCDTGITAHDAVVYSSSQDVDFIITDHHDLPEVLPNAVAIVNPKLLPSGHPLENLAGVGVAYILAEELLHRNPCQPSRELLDLVALGMIADLAVLKKDSRYLVQKGLEQLRETNRLGLRTMMEIAEITSSRLNEEHIGYVLGPRLNALGRLGDANPSVELLTTSDPVRARVLATQLEGLNIQRKLLCDQVYKAAEAQLLENPSLLAEPIIVLHHPSWPGGVIGIVAGKLTEKYGKPAILLTSPPNEPARGSARSIEGLNITEAITAQKDILLGFGGHPMAAGLSLEADKIPEFRRRISRTVEEILGDRTADERTLLIDGWVNLEQANLELSEELEKLAPFGPGNEKPILGVRDIAIREITEIGKNKEHLKLVIEDTQGKAQDVLYWDGHREELPEGRFDLAMTLRASDWKGTRRAQLEWIDFRQLEKKPVAVKSARLVLVDYRNRADQIPLLKSLPEGTLLWVEGPERKQLDGLDRNALLPTKSLAIWTTPPSMEILRHAMEKCSPEKVFVFAVNPSLDELKPFLERLAGLVKHSLNHKAGLAGIPDLAAACAQTRETILEGLKWLSLRGQITIEFLSEDQIHISQPKVAIEINDFDDNQKRLEALLQETAAFRMHFSKADAESLIP